MIEAARAYARVGGVGNWAARRHLDTGIVKLCVVLGALGTGAVANLEGSLAFNTVTGRQWESSLTFRALTYKHSLAYTAIFLIACSSITSDICDERSRV